MLTQIYDDDLKLLRVFRSVVECGGFSAAQAELNMTQSCISLHMAQLEKRLGMRLCSRGNTGFRLTDEGKFILRNTENLFSAVERFRLKSNEYASDIRGDIVIGISDIVATHENRSIIESIRSFSEKFSHARINLEILIPSELEEKLIKGQLDVCFGFFYHKVDSIQYRRMFDEKQVLYCGKGNVLYNLLEKDKKELSMSVLKNIPYVSRGHYEEATFPRQVFPLKESAFSASIEGLALLILTGRFIGYLPDHYAMRWVKRDEMRPLFETNLFRTSPCQMAIKKSGDRPRILNKFLMVVNDIQDSTAYTDVVVA